MSAAYRLHLRYCGGDVGHSERHGVGSFLVGLYVQTVNMFYKMGLTNVN